MKMHNTIFIILGVFGLILLGMGKVLTNDSAKKVRQSQSATLPGCPVKSMSGSLDGMFGAGFGTIRQSDSSATTMGILVMLIAHILVALGAGFYAVGKNRSPWFGLLGLLIPVGLLFLAVLEDKAIPEESIAQQEAL